MDATMKIKWGRLKNIASKLSGRKVVINLTTDNGMKGYNALVDFNSDEATIYLNGNKCKSLDMVIDAVAHELAHVITEDQQDSGRHKKTWDSLKEKIREEYNKV